eukprot:sb/3476052/
MDNYHRITNFKVKSPDPIRQNSNIKITRRKTFSLANAASPNNNIILWDKAALFKLFRRKSLKKGLQRIPIKKILKISRVRQGGIKVRFKRLDLRFLEIGALRVIFTKRDPEFPGISGQVV